jgi:hypothetical protein
MAAARVLDMVWALRVSKGGGGASAAKGEAFLDLDCGRFGGSWRVCGADGSGTGRYIGADTDKGRLDEARDRCWAERRQLPAEWVAADFRSPEGQAALLRRNGEGGGFDAVGLRAPLAWDGAHEARSFVRALSGLLRPSGWCWAVALNCDSVLEQFRLAGGAADVAFGPLRVTAVLGEARGKEGRAGAVACCGDRSLVDEVQ